MNIELTAILVGLSVMAFAFGVVALCVACIAWSTVVGLKNSTHQIQYVPIDGSSNEDDSNQSELNDKYEKATGFKYEEDEYI